MANQIYQYPNLATLQDNDLLLISDESTVNHDLKNITATQAKDYFFTSGTGVYTPTFSNFVDVTAVANVVSVYLIANTTVGNWVQISCRVSVSLGLLISQAFDLTVPFGNAFTDNISALMIGGVVDPGSTTAISPFRSAVSVPGSTRVTINLRVNSSIDGSTQVMDISFIYKII